MAENDKQGAVSLGDGRYKCPCGYIYDPEKGDPNRCSRREYGMTPSEYISRHVDQEP